MYFLTGSSMLSLPSCCSSTTAAAVNCLATEPDSKIVWGVFGTLNSMSASPNAFSKTGSPFSDTAAAQPGPGATYAFVYFSKPRSEPATTFSLLGIWAQAAVERNTTIAKMNKKFFLVMNSPFHWKVQSNGSLAWNIDRQGSLSSKDTSPNI